MKQENKTVFQKEIFDLPKEYRDSSLPKFLGDMYATFLSEIGKFNGKLKETLEPQQVFIEQLVKDILDSLNHYYNGLPALAYETLAGSLNQLDKNNHLPIQKTELPSERSSYYRVRVSSGTKLKKEDLFHIPFHMREKVSTQRYSIPGLPCLYLADSVYVCWEELGRPKFDDFHVSRFDLSAADFRLLYFDTLTDKVRKMCFGRKGEVMSLNILVSFLCYWPLLAGCSILVKKQNEIFKPEYIIPQLLLQWIVAEKKADGIFYRSNRVKISPLNVGTFTNVVIPVKTIASEGYCKTLKSAIRLTNPLNWQTLEIAGGKSSEDPVDIADLRRVMYIELFDGEKAPYSETHFGKLESKLRRVQTSSIK